MWYKKYNEAEIREIAKEHIEALEYWLRRLINDELTNSYEKNYNSLQTSEGHFLIKKKIREEVQTRISTNDKGRFPRWIDATTFDHLVDIICNPTLYKSSFRKVFHNRYIFDTDQIRIELGNLLEIRNRLYHLNPISNRQAEQAICYSNDFIDCIKNYYHETSQYMSFNAPSIIKYSDSYGNQFFSEHFIQSSIGVIVPRSLFNHLTIRCGDSIKIELEIDASFDRNEYTIIWSLSGFDTSQFNNSNSFQITFTEAHVSTNCQINAKIISNKAWHRHKYFDDQIDIQLTVYPPN